MFLPLLEDVDLILLLFVDTLSQGRLQETEKAAFSYSLD